MLAACAGVSAALPPLAPHVATLRSGGRVNGAAPAAAPAGGGEQLAPQVPPQPTPQADAYRGWIKQQLAAGHGIAWMIMLQGAYYPVYPSLPYGFYSHVEPVLGIYSGRPLRLLKTEWVKQLSHIDYLGIK